MTAHYFILAYLATGAAIAVLAPIVGVSQIQATFGNNQQQKFMCAVVATFFFVGSIVVTALLWPALIVLATHYNTDSEE